MVVSMLAGTAVFVIGAVMSGLQVSSLKEELISQQRYTGDVIEAYCKEATGLPNSDGLNIDSTTDHVTSIGCHDGTNHTRIDLGESN